MHFLYFINKLDIECCLYDESCTVDFKKINKIIRSLFNNFVIEDGVVSPKEDTVAQLYSAINPCGYTVDCGDNNIEEVMDELYEYFENSMSDNFQYLTVPKAVELGLIRYDNQVRFTTTPYVDMDELWVYKESFHKVLTSLQKSSYRTGGYTEAKAGWEEQFKEALKYKMVLFEVANKKEVLEALFEKSSFEVKDFMREHGFMQCVLLDKISEKGLE